MNAARSKPGRTPELDALRGLAALTICIYHIYPLSWPLFVGWSMVDLFFVLSGYLITGIILRNMDQGSFLINFYARRNLRIWPIYYLTLLAVVAVNPFLPAPSRLDGLPNYLTYTQNIQKYWSGPVPAFPPYLNHAWTLAIEEQYYLIWPVLACLAGRRWVAPLALAFLATSVAARAAGYSTMLLLARCDGLALGSLLAVLLLDGGRVRRNAVSFRYGFAAVTLAAAAYLVGYVAIYHRGPLLFWAGQQVWIILAFNLAYFGVVGGVACSVGHPRLAFLRDRRLCDLGLISYGLYLYHIPVYAVANHLGDAYGRGQAWWLQVVKVAASLAAAALSWRYVERPILALKDRFHYGPAPAPAPSPAAGALPQPGLAPER